MRYIAYTDGSYRDTPIGGVYGSAAVVAREGADDCIKLTRASQDEFSSMRNVAGEVMAVINLLDYCANELHLTKDDTVIVHHDYIGISNWVKPVGDKNFWRAKNRLTQSYRHDVVDVYSNQFNIEFVHTPGHKGIHGNELVDVLAADAINTYVRGKMKTE